MCKRASNRAKLNFLTQAFKAQHQVLKAQDLIICQSCPASFDHDFGRLDAPCGKHSASVNRRVADDDFHHHTLTRSAGDR